LDTESVKRNSLLVEATSSLNDASHKVLAIGYVAYVRYVSKGIK
jgi:hypothetical protein